MSRKRAENAKSKRDPNELLTSGGAGQRAAKKGLKLMWFSTGVNDGLMATTRSTVDVLKKHSFNVEFKESPGAHTWINWRNYLNEFAPRLFQ